MEERYAMTLDDTHEGKNLWKKIRENILGSSDNGKNKNKSKV